MKLNVNGTSNDSEIAKRPHGWRSFVKFFRHKQFKIRHLIYCMPGILIVLWLSVWVLNIGQIRGNMYVRNHRIARTMYQLQSMERMIQITVHDTNGRVLEEIPDLTIWLRTYSEDFFESDPSCKQWLDPTGKVFVDNWDSPIKLTVLSREKYMLTSFGPNRRNEWGRKDDISRIFNPRQILDTNNWQASDNKLRL